MRVPFKSTCAPSVFLGVITRFIYLSFVIDVIRRDHRISVPWRMTLAANRDFTSAIAILTFVRLLYENHIWYNRIKQCSLRCVVNTELENADRRPHTSKNVGMNI